MKEGFFLYFHFSFLILPACFAQPDRVPRSFYFKVHDPKSKAINFIKTLDGIATKKNTYRLEIFDVFDTNISYSARPLLTVSDKSGATVELKLDPEKLVYRILILHRLDTMSVVLKFFEPVVGVYELDFIPFRKGEINIELKKYLIKDPDRDVYKVVFTNWETIK